MTLPTVYVIHCKELEERTEVCRRHLAEVGIPAIFWRSYHGKTWGLRTVKEYDTGKCISPGHVGLNLGTWALWQHALYSPNGFPDQRFIFFEDDVQLPMTFAKDIDDIQHELLAAFPDWDLVFLGLAEIEPHVWNKVTERIGNRPNSRLCRMNDPFGTHAYMVRRRALPILLDNMTVAERNLDQQLFERVLKPGKLKWCAVLPSLVRQRTFDYAGTGKVEWNPSTVEKGEEGYMGPMPVLAADEQDVKRMCGQVDVPGRPSPEMLAATSQLVDPFPCIYRGEPMDDIGTTEHGRTVPINHCARLDKPCHSKKAPVFLPEYRYGFGARAVRCEECSLRSGMELKGEIRPRLPLPEGHFNPSMAMWKDKLILATRDSWGHSKLALWELRNDNDEWTGKWRVSPIGSFSTDHAEAPRLEDPRLFVSTDPITGKNSLCAMLNLPDGYPPKRVQVGYVRFDEGLTKIIDTQVYKSPANNLYEKNWVPFETPVEGINWIYSTKPKHVVIGARRTCESPNPLPWTGGIIRGGASPVFVPRTSEGEMSYLMKTGKLNGERWPLSREHMYYHFFHGCLKRFQGSVYTVGCCVFEATPPYRVLRQTPTPLIWPDLPGANESVVKRYVVWPGGAVPHAGAWHLALGIDDTCCRIVRLPFGDVEAALKSEPAEEMANSIRDTPIAKGIHESEK